MLVCFVGLSFHVFAEEFQDTTVKTSQFEVGIENSRLIYGKYIYKDFLSAKLNVSVYSENIKWQYVRVTLGYHKKLKMFNIVGDLFFGSSLNGNYYNMGAVIKGDAEFLRRLLLDASLVPWYDSGYGYITCFETKIGCKITSHIDVKVGYTTVPQYRMSERRIIGGFDFTTSRLYVSPYVSIGTGVKSGGKNIRVIMGFGYKF